MENTNTKILRHFNVTKELDDALKAESKRSDLSASQIVRRAVETYLKQSKQAVSE